MFDTSSLKYVYFSTLGENFQIYGVQNTGKWICQSNIYYVPIDKPPHLSRVLTINLQAYQTQILK